MAGGLGRSRVIDQRWRCCDQCVLDNPHRIIKMNPAQPLRAGTQPRLNANLKRLRHLAQRPALFGQHHAETQRDNLHPRRRSLARLLLPLLAQRRRKALACARGLGKDGLIRRPVVANGTGTNQPLGRLGLRSHPLDQIAREINTARDNFTLVRAVHRLSANPAPAKLITASTAPAQSCKAVTKVASVSLAPRLPGQHGQLMAPGMQAPGKQQCRSTRSLL